MKKEMKNSFAHVALFAAGFHLSLVLFKYGLGIFSGSIALQADSFHSLVDALCSLTVFAGIKISEKKSSIFPFGLYKVENLVSLAVSMAIFYTAYEIVMDVVNTDQAYVIANIPTAILGLLLIITYVFLFSRYMIKMGKKAGSPSLIADAKHIGADLFSTGGILIGLTLGLIGINVDFYLAIGIALMIFKLGVTIFFDAVKVLLDASVNKDKLDQIKKIFFDCPFIKEVFVLSGRSSGRYIFVEAEVAMAVEKLEDAHEIASNIEEEVYDFFPEIEKLIIHFEPYIDKVYQVDRVS